MAFGRVKQSRMTSAVGFFGGLVFIGLGVFVIVPIFGWFGVAWTAIAVIITAAQGYAFFSKQGGPLYEMEFDERRSSRGIAERLAELDESKRRGLVTEDEYREQRERIMSDF